jgi:hypothetical protein
MWLRICCLGILIAVAAPCYAVADNIDAWKKQIALHLSKSQGLRPETAGKSGTAQVGLVIDRSGKLISSWLVDSAGIPALDTEALAVLNRFRHRRLK